MKYTILDYGGYAFPVQLSRELARRGNSVLHVHSAFYPPKGKLWREPTDPDGFTVEELDIGEKFQKYNFVKRRFQERKFGTRFVEKMTELEPDIVIATNTPLETASIINKYCRRNNIPYVHWAQDIHGLAIKRVVKKKMPFLGNLIGAYYLYLERNLIRSSNAVIVISSSFIDIYKKLRFENPNLHVIPNWMPLDEISIRSKNNPWAVEHGLEETFNIGYVGTLSLKHEPEVFCAIARHYQSRPEVRIVLVGGGVVMDEIAERKKEHNLENLILLGWQDFELLSNIMASCDILMAAITPDASDFSVPCKVQTYLCAGRPVLAVIPKSNHVARILIEHDMGFVADPLDIPVAIDAMDRLYNDADLRGRMGKNARNYAEETFDIHRITDRFQDITTSLLSSCSPGSNARPANAR